FTSKVDPKLIKGPRLIVTGTEDRLIPAKVHRAMAAKYGAELREYAQHGHYLMREPGWERIADDAIAWLHTVVGADLASAPASAS
ncbi:MAG TPA: hypothetical protein VMZ53_31685, partial [Kofleriaceae bacterium]|nr:hypothetical protein [Kofleriaceae bacterium]